jgi:hypothetical protein
VTCEISAWEDIIVQVVLSAEMLKWLSKYVILILGIGSWTWKLYCTRCFMKDKFLKSGSPRRGLLGQIFRHIKQRFPNTVGTLRKEST